MFIFAANLIGAGLAWLLSLWPASDARQALAEGVFSATSIVGYSVGKSVLLYVFYIALAAVLGFGYMMWARRRPETGRVEVGEGHMSGLPIIQKKEILFLALVVVFFAVANYACSVNFFDANAIRSEEFYNLSAMEELRYEQFDIIYPYAIGNIIFADLFRNIGLDLMAYKTVLNSVALVFLYLAIAIFVKGRRRIIYFSLIVLFYLQPIISPSLHRNLLRFCIPFFVLSSLYLIHNNLGKKTRNYIYLFLVNVLVLLLSSADVLVVSYVVYSLFISLSWLKERDSKKFLLYASGPLAALAFLFIIFGWNEFYLLQHQLLAIPYYSGFVNTNPYVDIFEIFRSDSPWQLLKNASNVLIFYLPPLIIFNLVLFFICHIKKINIDLSSPLTYAMILTPAYFIYHRQTLGDAGVGRIGIAAIILMFITIILAEVRNKPAYLRLIYHTALVFFIAIFSVNLYFLRYSLVDIYNAQLRDKTGNGVMLCADTPFSQQLKFAGFTYCDKSFVAELSALKETIGNNQFYVFDDTFAFYYLFGARPVVLIPAYSMSHSGQAEIIKKIADNDIFYIIYPRDSAFFGVPPASVGNENFMGLIKNLIQEKYRLAKKSPLFYLYQAK